MCGKTRDHCVHVTLSTILALSILLITSGSASAKDRLFVGDNGDNTVKAFDAHTGAALGIFVPSAPPGVDCSQSPSPAGCIIGPRGLVITPRIRASAQELLLANQNVGQSFNGEILSYDVENDLLQGAVVSNSDPDGPFAPRGIVLSPDAAKLFVADVRNPGENGAVKVFTVDGTFVRNLQPPALGGGKEFHPRGVVIGPDGLLYVSNVPVLPPPGDIGGQVFRFNPKTLQFVDVFVDDAGGTNRLNRPEGLVFSPNGMLYITSFQNRLDTANDVDRIIIYNGPRGPHPAKRVGQIDLWQSGQPRAFAQALLFGPGSRLFIPIAGTSDAGQVRRYRVAPLPDGSTPFDEFIPAGGSLQSGWYLTFEHSDPSTLAYRRIDVKPNHDWPPRR